MSEGMQGMAGKRKRDLVDGEIATEMDHTNGVEDDLQHSQKWMKDALHILRSHDTTSSIFDYQYDPPTASQPSPKRTKSSDSPLKTSVAAKIEKGEYDAIDELVADLGIASGDYLNDVQKKIGEGKAMVRDLETAKSHVETVQKRLNGLIAGEMFQRQRVLRYRHETAKQDGDLDRIPTIMSGDKSGMILTLTGGERSAKQLFSSLSKPGNNNTAFEEKPLPNGIHSTSVVPVHSLESDKNSTPTIGQTFPPPSNLKPLNPPRPASKHTSTRSSSINWYNPSDVTTSTKEASSRDPYSKQPHPTGKWLTYNTSPTSDQFDSPGSRKKHRDRALSSGEPPSAIDKETSVALAQAKDDALFRSVYSSFAPSKDDTGAVIAEEQKNRLWWNKYGEAQYAELLDFRGDLLDGEDGTEDMIPEEELNEKIVEEAIAEWKPMSIDEISSGNNAKDQSLPQEAKDLLEEISELLEVLNSHQRVRNLSQPANARPLQGQKEQLASAPSDPSSPSSAEMEVYESLKTQLVEVLATLPPYMLAKLNGDQLGALQLSTKLKISAKTQKGTLEDDWTSAKAKPAPSGTYSNYGASSTVRGGYSSTPTQPYTRPAPTQTPVQRQPTSAGYAASQYPGRPASTHYGGSNVRPTYGAQYPQQRSSSSYVDRFTNGQYTPQPSYSSYGQYANSYRPPLGQQASSYGQQYASPQPRIPPASTPAAQAYQQRAPPPPAYNYGSTPAASQYTPNVSQAPFTGQAMAANQQRPPLYQQHNSHYGSGSPAADQMNGAGADRTGTMSPANQAVQDTRRSMPGSVTPQPAPSQSPRPNGTQIAQPNGVTT